jgi:hypothetical protein
MAKVVLISCVSRKLGHKARAGELYVSDLFKKNLAYARSLAPHATYILSAKHGLLSLDDEIAPYNETLNTMKDAQVRAWAAKVLEQMRGRVGAGDELVFLAGEKYRKYLLPHFRNTSVPMQGLGIGRQLAFLKHALTQ